MRKYFVKAIACVAFLCASQAAAQSTNASLSGNVVDASGGALPLVMIKLEDIQTGVVLTGTSNEAGVYQFPSVQPGLYRLEAEFPGFQRVAYNLLTIEVAAQVRLNLTLKVAGAAANLEVINLDSPLKGNTASVGSVISGTSVRDLPLATRSVLELTQTLAGTVLSSFSGTRIGTLNVTRDGINVMDQFLNGGVNSVITTTTDLVSEFRVITSPADAEFARGSGQVQIDTRSGTNQFHGSVFQTHNDTSLNANSWFNNLRGDPRNTLVWNQFGARLGGPVVKNKTFFHFLFDAQRRVDKFKITSTTYTAEARQGIFRFFPGVTNANARAAVPTVDLNGNPLRPAAATGDVQSLNVFNTDPTRPVMDPSGAISKLLSRMPLPNDFTVGDGLNTAGHTWRRRRVDDRDQYNVRVDHQFNEHHRLNVSWTRETRLGLNVFIPQNFSESPRDKSTTAATFLSLNVTSALSSRLLNQFHAGVQRAAVRSFAPWELEGKELLPSANGFSYLVNFSPPISNLINSSFGSGGPRGRISPLYVWGNKLAWLTGRHAFKVGGEVRFGSSNVFTSIGVTPVAEIGGSASFPSLPPGLGGNISGVFGLLLNLTGSVSSVSQVLNASAGANPVFLAGESKQRTWRQREFSVFFKDDWSLRPDLGLNAGIRYEYYGVPWEANGKAAAPVGGSKGLFGLSGTSFADLYQPGRMNGSLTRIELVGKNSANPKAQLYGDDWKNFAPAIGLNWSIPYFGKDKTVLRVGYSIGYERNALGLGDVVSGDEPGLRTSSRTSQYPSLSTIQLPLTPLGRPLETVGLDDRSQTVWAFDSNLRTPYVQNWNLSVERELSGKMSLAVRYVGSKGTKLIRATNINEVNIFESQILDAFLVTQSGGNAPLFDRMLNGVIVCSVPGSPNCLPPVNGTTVTGSRALRFSLMPSIYFGSNSVGSFANWLNTTAEFTGTPGGLLRRADLPENSIVANPQFREAYLEGNFANSTYHAMQVDLNKRFSGGWNLQSNYTWSKTLGEEEGSSQTHVDSYRDGRNRRLDKRLLSYHVNHVFRNSGTFELPFGPNRRFANNGPGIISRLIERWEFGGIVNFFSGTPIGFTSAVTSFNEQFGTPDLVGVLPKNAGRVTRTANGVVYFPELRQIQDTALTGPFARAIADAGGNILLRHPAPGKLGNMSQRYLEGPGWYRVDVDLIKRIRLGEAKDLEFRAVVIGLLNSPVFGSPNTDIGSTSFGNITSATGNRLVELHARINF
ncbi:MAG: carboxypeptidase regulatory-like domain-containing protein [Acidobacteria bacterium]|nr:carboxypeptidase regulatory-like domain-containing protein [Acidobacteriota bacterium]